MMSEPARSSEQSLNLRATMALAVGAAFVPFAAANADPIVTQVNTDFPATISFDGTIAFTFTGATGFTATGSNLVAGSDPTAYKYLPGAVIDANTFASGGLSTGRLGVSAKGISSYFIGLEVVGSNGQDYFGYAEIGLGTGFAFTVPDALIEYAFESDPNTAITIPSIPEPGSLALLATGVAGALAIRRRSTKSRQASA
jgi:hypothetical protein